MTYPVFIFPSDQPTEIWAHNGCIFAVSNGQVDVLCRPHCSPSGCTMPARQFSIQSAETPAAAPHHVDAVPAPPVHTPVPEPQLPPIHTIAVIETPEAISGDDISVVA